MKFLYFLIYILFLNIVCNYSKLIFGNTFNVGYTTSCILDLVVILSLLYVYKKESK